MSARVYFYDVDSCEELASYVYLGTSEAGIHNGRRYIGTHLGYSVQDGRESRCVRASEFGERRVAAKVWYGPQRSEWTLLVSRERGWLGNEADVPGGTPHAELPARLQRLLARVKRASAKRGRAYRHAVAEAVAA